MKFGVGQSVGRFEDTRFYTGSECETDDEDTSAGLRDAFMRASRADAKLRSRDNREAG